MTRQILKGLALFMTVVGVVVASAAVANAQREELNAQIPFDFIVGSKTLPYGAYQVRGMSDDGRVLQIRSADAKAQALCLTDRTERNDKDNEPARLIFHRYGSTYFLAEVWAPGATIGRELLKSRQERAMERELIARSRSGQPFYEVVEIVATVR